MFVSSSTLFERGISHPSGQPNHHWRFWNAAVRGEQATDRRREEREPRRMFAAPAWTV
jgi:hypothetical protein